MEIRPRESTAQGPPEVFGILLRIRHLPEILYVILYREDIRPIYRDVEEVYLADNNSDFQLPIKRALLFNKLYNRSRSIEMPE